MNKIICDICGSSYPDTAERCPICGSSREYALSAEAQEPQEPEQVPAESKKRSLFPEVLSEEFYDYEEDDEEEPPLADEPEPPAASARRRTNWFAVVLLSLVILALLGATGFLFFRFYVPHVIIGTEPAETTAEATLPPETEVTTDPTVPCKSIVLTAGVPELTRIGQYWLLHTIVLPENTTDPLIYISADENVVTVTEEGRLCAVGEGETTVIISCGNEEILCQVIVKIPEVVDKTAEDAEPSEEEPQQISSEETQVEESSSGEFVLKLKQSDLSFLKKGATYQLELDCDVDPKDVEWFTMDPKVALCHDGLVTIIGAGTTRIGARYNGQEVFCVIRVNLS